MIEANRIKLGLFVLTGILLLAGLLLLLGLLEIFQPKIKYMTYFDESVQGLEIGSPVKYRGATIGKVTKITIRRNNNIIRVDMEGLVSAIDVPGHHPAKEAVLSESRAQLQARLFREWLEQETGRGLRCRLELSGITGMKYVELDYFNPDEPQVIAPPPRNDDIIYLPSTPSLLRGLRTSVSESLSGIAAVDFRRISEELVLTLTSISRILNDDRVERLIARIDNASGYLESTAANLNETLSRERIQETATELQSGLRSYRELATSLREELAAAKFAETAAAARATADQANLTLAETAAAARAMAAMREQVSRSLSRLDETFDTLTELVRALDQDPGSLLHGKQPQSDAAPTGP